MADRIYTEKEVAALLERTVALQAQRKRQDEQQPGLTLAELEAVAIDAGLDPALLREAAEEMNDPRSLRVEGTKKSATHIFVERWVKGEYSPDGWEDVVAELRHRYSSDVGKSMGMAHYGDGTVEQLGRTVSWKHTSVSGIETRVLIRPRGEGVQIQLSQRVGLASPTTEGVMYGTLIALFIAFVAGAVADSSLLGVGVMLVSMLAAIPLVRQADIGWRKKKHRELEALGDRVATLMTPPTKTTDQAPVAVPDSMPAYAAPQTIDQTLLEDERDGASSPQSARTRTRNT